MTLTQAIVWVVTGLGSLVTFGISYWAVLKFNNILIQVAFCFLAVIVGHLAYISAWPLFTMVLVALHFVDAQEFLPFAKAVGFATGVNGWSELGGGLVISAAGFVVAARRSKKSASAN